MGNTIAQNTATESINNTIGISSTQLANCATLVDSSQGLHFTAANGGTINIDDSTLLDTSAYQIDASCFSSQSATSSVNSQIAQSAALQTKAVSQNLDFNPATTKANAVASAITNSAISVSSTQYQSCLESVTQNQDITFNATNGGTINLKNVFAGLENVTTAMNKCVFSQSYSSNVTSGITQSISSVVQATVNDALAWILIAIAIIVLVFFFITFEFLGWALIILLVVGVIIGIYIIIARIKYCCPFSRPAPTLPATLSTSLNLTTSGPATLPFSSKAGSYEFVFNFKQPTAVQTFTLATGTYSANYTIFPGITQITTNAITLAGGTSSLVLTLTSSGPIEFTSIVGNTARTPIKLGTGTTNLSTKSITISSTTPASFLVSGPSANGQYIVTLNGVTSTANGVAPNLYVLVDPGTSTGATSGNPPTTGLGYVTSLPAPTTPPAPGMTVNTSPLTLNAGTNHNIYVTVDSGSINVSSITIAPSTTAKSQ